MVDMAAVRASAASAKRRAALAHAGSLAAQVRQQHLLREITTLREQFEKHERRPSVGPIAASLPTTLERTAGVLEDPARLADHHAAREEAKGHIAAALAERSMTEPLP